jgi:hypothetical protein
MTYTEKQARKTLRQKGIKAFWYFKSEAVQYGVAMVEGKPMRLIISNTKNELIGRAGFPVHFSPTPKMEKGLAAARKFCKAVA